MMFYSVPGFSRNRIYREDGGSMLGKDGKRAIVYVMPGVILSALIVLYPLLYIVVMSFSSNGFSMGGFVGFKNYTRLFRNPQFSKAVLNTIKFVLGSVIGAFVIGFGLSLLVNRNRTKFKGFWRSVLFIAWVIPGVAKATIFKWIFQTESGVLNDTLQKLSLIDSPIPWLSNSSIALWSLVIVQIWSTAPYVMLILTSSLQQVPVDLYESAELDGASWYQKLLHVTLPQVKDSCFVAILMLIIWSLGEFSLIWLTTSGGNNTTTLSILIYNQFRVMDINASAASAIMQLLVTMAFAVVYVKMVSKKED